MVLYFEQQGFLFPLAAVRRFFRYVLSLPPVSHSLKLLGFRLSAVDTVKEAEIRKQEICRKAEELLNTYGNPILRLAYSYLHNKEDAEDILQDTMIQYLKTAPVLESPAHERAWLLKVAANLSKNKIVSNNLRSTDQLEENLAAQDREDLSFVWEAVKSLPEKYREVIHLFHYEGCSTADISRILERKESTVRSDLRRGRQQLKEILKEEYDFE